MNQQVAKNWSLESLEERLKHHFGYNAFRPLQADIIQSLLNQKDVLAILPTGAGKSLCYQLPALLCEGTAVVISPLISLMQDQVVSLYKNGISAAYINSSLSSQEMREVEQNLSEYKLLYVAPERFAVPEFLEFLKRTPISFFVIDEAHCISQWGHSFRGEYRKLSILKELYPSCPVIALTATATDDVEKDIQSQLGMNHPVVVKSSFDRPNLTLFVESKFDAEKQLRDFLQRQQNRSGIIYAGTRKGVDAIFNQLIQEGFPVGRYHAGMSEQERSSAQHDFLHDHTTLMVATVAFGMGIHKPDIRFIVHMDMPRTIEQYYQEIGRAGRDGLPADCLMIYGMQDLMIYKSFVEKLEDPIIKRQMKFKTEGMFKFCTSLNCRRSDLLRYFGEKYPKPNCGSCDNCLDQSELMDGTEIAQKILSCVFRLKQNVGIRMVIDVLRGSKNRSLIRRGYDQLSTYALLQEMPQQEVRYYIDCLLYLKMLDLTEGEYPVLRWTETSQKVVKGEATVTFKRRLFKASQPAKEIFKGRENLSLQYDEGLFQDLRTLRLNIAREEQVPPYVVFSDRALQEMAVYFPTSKEEFSQINGVGPIKWEKYGEKFLHAIDSYGGKASIPMEVACEPVKRVRSREATLALFFQGRNVEEIMEERGLVKSTVMTHLVESIEQGEDLDLSRLMPQEKQEAIKLAILDAGLDRLTPIKERLPPEYTFDDIRLVAAFYRRTTEQGAKT